MPIKIDTVEVVADIKEIEAEAEKLEENTIEIPVVVDKKSFDDSLKASEKALLKWARHLLQYLRVQLYYLQV